MYPFSKSSLEGLLKFFQRHFPKSFKNPHTFFGKGVFQRSSQKVTKIWPLVTMNEELGGLEQQFHLLPNYFHLCYDCVHCKRILPVAWSAVIGSVSVAISLVSTAPGCNNRYETQLTRCNCVKNQTSLPLTWCTHETKNTLKQKHAHNL